MLLSSGERTERAELKTTMRRIERKLEDAAKGGLKKIELTPHKNWRIDAAAREILRRNGYHVQGFFKENDDNYSFADAYVNIEVDWENPVKKRLPIEKVFGY